MSGTAYDVVLGETSKEAVGGLIVQHLAIKGFCVVGGGLTDNVVDNAIDEVNDLEANFSTAHPLIREGLLGSEGSVRIADLETTETRPDDDDGNDDVELAGEYLTAIDQIISRIALLIDPYLSRFSFDITHRTASVIHQGGVEEDEEPEEDEEDENELPLSAGSHRLSGNDAAKWMNQFLRHKVMVMVFLGPKSSELVFKTHEDTDAQPLSLGIAPGTIVVLRPDLLSCHNMAVDKSIAITSFFLAGPLRKRTPQDGFILTPAAQKLDNWTWDLLKKMKLEDDPDRLWSSSVPDTWRQAMNFMYTKAQLIGIRGMSGRSVCSEDPETSFLASMTAPDFAIEVPLNRWEHTGNYDGDPNSWTWAKTSCKHGCFIEGVELFDNKMFSLSINEAKGLDPHYRHLLEMSYQALHSCGLKKSSIMNSHTGIFVAFGNQEFAFTAGAGHTSGISCFAAGRTSFCLGVKGPSLTIDCDTAAGLVTTYLAAESNQPKGTAKVCPYSIATATMLNLCPVWWPLYSSKGQLNSAGRVMTFNSTANGYIRGDGVQAIVTKVYTSMVDGEMVINDEEDWISTLAGITMNNNGQCAGVMSPSGPAEQEVITQAMRIASVAPEHIDGVEANGIGAFICDAIEVGSIMRSHRSQDMSKDRYITINAHKTSAGNQKEASPIAALLRNCFAAQYGAYSPNLHMRQVNPHMNYFGEPMVIPTEPLEFPESSTYNGTLARGIGGTNVYCITLGRINSFKRAPPPPETQREPILFWPGGGGELDDEQQPTRGYMIVGSFSQWINPKSFQRVDDTLFTYELTLGENRWESFQIWLDGDDNKVLHPGCPHGTTDCPVHGPDAEVARENYWLIDGRNQLMPVSTSQAEQEEGEESPEDLVEWVEMPSVDYGLPGDKYLIKLQILGKYRLVSWEKTAPSRSRETTTNQMIPQSSAKYSVHASWSDWELEEMMPDTDTPGKFTLDIELPMQGGVFQIVRNDDFTQVIYPTVPDSGPEESTLILGPDDMGYDLRWYIPGMYAQLDAARHRNKPNRWRIEFERRVTRDTDFKKVNWYRLEAD